MNTPSTETSASSRPSRALVVGICVFVVSVAGAGFVWFASRSEVPTGAGMGETGAAAQVPATPSPGAPQAADPATMVGPLAERLKKNPDDAEALWMLGRVYAALDRAPEALPLYKHLTTLRASSAQAHTDYAKMLAAANGRRFNGEAEQELLKALQLDPDHAMALTLAGKVAFDRGDMATAAARWEKALARTDAQSPLHTQLQAALRMARSDGAAGGSANGSAGTPPAAVPEPAPASASASSIAARIEGQVSLAPALRDQVRPDDTVFVFVRAAQGPKMPLAALRKQVRDLPFSFSLDDSKAMGATALLSATTQPVVVVARISKSGQPLHQSGDLQVESAPVMVGETGLRLEIAPAK